MSIMRLFKFVDLVGQVTDLFTLNCISWLQDSK